MNGFCSEKPGGAVPVYLMDAARLAQWLEKQSDSAKARVRQTGFKAAPGQICLLPSAKGLKAVLAGQDPHVEARWSLARVRGLVHEGTFYLADRLKPEAATGLCLSWALAGYSYRGSAGKTEEETTAQLVWPKNVNRAYVEAAARATCLVRDLISTPGNLMGPADLANAAMGLAKTGQEDPKQASGEKANAKQANCRLIVGDDLIRQNFPAIHAVGRAAHGADRAPRLIDLRWCPGQGAIQEKTQEPKVTLVGKGVCFDSGGLDLKGPAFMRWMKKDMGGSAHVLGLASMIMDLDVPVQLRVLIPAVENAVAGNAFRPGDVIDTRLGLTVEIGNTDAEGRLVLADALAYACEDEPDLIIDFATLTGAARVALGPDLPAVFCNNDSLAAKMQAASDTLLDPSWRMPLHQPYAAALASSFADTNNIAEAMPQGGAITAALFLEKFVTKGTPWMHLDVMAWNTNSKPGRPKGGEAMGMLAAFAALRTFLDV